MVAVVLRMVYLLYIKRTNTTSKPWFCTCFLAAYRPYKLITLYHLPNNAGMYTSIHIVQKPMNVHRNEQAQLPAATCMSEFKILNTIELSSSNTWHFSFILAKNFVLEFVGLATCGCSKTLSCWIEIFVVDLLVFQASLACFTWVQCKNEYGKDGTKGSVSWPRWSRWMPQRASKSIHVDSCSAP